MKLLYKKDGGFTSGTLQFTDKGEYEVEKTVAETLCNTFPSWFEEINPKQKVEAPAEDKTSTETKKTTLKK